MDKNEQLEMDRRLATTAEALFLINLLLLPGVGFAMLVALNFGSRGGNCPLSRNHLSQTVGVSVLGAILVVSAAALFFLLGGFGIYTKLLALLYFICIHLTLVIMGIIGFSKAIKGQHYSFPLVGRFFTA